MPRKNARDQPPGVLSCDPRVPWTSLYPERRKPGWVATCTPAGGSRQGPALPGGRVALDRGGIRLLVTSVFSRLAAFPVHKDEPILDNLLFIVTRIKPLVRSGPPPPRPGGTTRRTIHRIPSTDSISQVPLH